MAQVKTLHPSAPQEDAIVVAGCETMAETNAMLRWILPVLQQWPKSAWHIWIADVTNHNDIKAAKVHEPTEKPHWQPVEHLSSSPADAVCRILGGRAGLVIFAEHVIATAATRGLDGLVAAIACFPANDPLATPLKKSFASFGVSAGI